MIPIYICDDNESEKKFLEKIINNHILIESYDMKVVLASTDPVEILGHRKSHDWRSVYFFDVDLKNDKYNGFTLAKQIREIDPRGFLVFITTHEELVFETFKYHLEAMSYLTKDNQAKLQPQIRECLEEISVLVGNERNDTNSYYTVKIGESSYHVPLREILYFETAGPHRIRLHTGTRMLEFRGELNAIEKELRGSFFKTHRSYLVHLSNIKKTNFSEQTIVMEDDSICLMSRKGKRALKAYFHLTEENNHDF